LELGESYSLGAMKGICISKMIKKKEMAGIGLWQMSPIPPNAWALYAPPPKQKGHRSRNGLISKLPLLDLNQGPTD
jgi:hypothetical protein